MWRHVLQFCERPLHLLLLLVLANSLWMPYRGIRHDARLYAFEVVNQLEDNALHDELSLCYAKAGKFSIFSALALPATQLLGVHASFFLIYLVSKTLFLAAIQRLTCAMIPKRSIAIISLLLMAVTGIGFGGMRVFNANESFLTPRVLATALVLFGLERLIRARWIQSFLLLGIAMTIHPLMAISGLLVWMVVCGLHFLTRRQQLIACSLAMLGGTIILAVPSLGLRLFGEMDPLWKDCVDDFNMYSVPYLWEMIDWVRILTAFLLVTAGLMTTRMKPNSNPVVMGVLIVSGIGIVGSLISVLTPYALLFQGQSYRALWLVQLLQVPVGLFLAHRCWAQEQLWSYFAGFGITAYLLAECRLPTNACCLFAAVLLCAALWDLPRTKKRRLLGTSAASILILLSLTSAPLAVLAGLRIAPTVFHDVDLLFWWYFATQTLGTVFGILIVLGVAASLHRLTNHSTARLSLLGLALGISAIAYWLPHSSISRSLGAGNYQTVSMIDRYLTSHYRSDGAVPTVYWSRGESAMIWHQLHARSYLCIEQLAGNMFLRSSAIEGRRRAELVAPFDVAAFESATTPGPGWEKTMIERVYRRPANNKAPTRDDLQRLANEPQLDVIVLHHNIDNLYDATHGQVFLYDAQRLRERLCGNNVAVF